MNTPIATRPATPRQAEVLDFIRGHMARRGYSPSIREIAAHFGFSSPNGAMCHIRALTAKGAITRAFEGQHHGYVPVVPAGHCPCCGQEVAP